MAFLFYEEKECLHIAIDANRATKNKKLSKRYQKTQLKNAHFVMKRLLSAYLQSRYQSNSKAQASTSPITTKKTPQTHLAAGAATAPAATKAVTKRASWLSCVNII